jgi:predicted molibdopterin-dependent oxidoreductase YjgC
MAVTTVAYLINREERGCMTVCPKCWVEDCQEIYGEAEALKESDIPRSTRAAWAMESYATNECQECGEPILKD